MKTLKNLLDNQPPSNYKEIAQMIMDEHKDALNKADDKTQPASDDDTGISKKLRDTLKANLVGFGPHYNATLVQDIIDARLLTWQAGGTGISPQTFIKLSESAESLKYQTDIPKENSYTTDTTIPASHLLNQFLKETDYYTDFPDTDIDAFISGDFIALGEAAALVHSINPIWVGFCFNSANAIALSGITLNATDPMGPGSSELVALKNLLTQNTVDASEPRPTILRSTVPALKVLGLIDFINDINVTDESKAASNTHHYLHGINEIPEQLYITFSKMWNYLKALDTSLSTKNAATNEFAYAVVDLIEQLRHLLITMVDRTRTLLSGRIKDVKDDAFMGKSDLGLNKIVGVLESISAKASADQRRVVETVSVDFDEVDNGDSTLLLNILSSLLEDVRHAILVERFAHIYIAERVPAINDRLRKMRQDAQLSLNTILSKDFYKALPTPITDHGLAQYLTSRFYDFGGNYGPSVFHDHSLLDLLKKHDVNDDTAVYHPSTDGQALIDKLNEMLGHDSDQEDAVVVELKDRLIGLRNQMDKTFSEHRAAKAAPSLNILANPISVYPEDIEMAKQAIKSLKKSMRNHPLPLKPKMEADCNKLITEFEADIAAAEEAIAENNAKTTKPNSILNSNNADAAAILDADKKSVIDINTEDKGFVFLDTKEPTSDDNEAVIDTNDTSEAKESIDASKAPPFDAKAISKGFSKLFDNKAISNLLGGKPKFLDDEEFLNKADKTISEVKGVLRDTEKEVKHLLRDTEKALGESPAFMAAKDFFDIKDTPASQPKASDSEDAGKSDANQSVYDTFDEYLEKLKTQTARMNATDTKDTSNTYVGPKELILEAKAALEIANDMLTGTSGIIMKQVLGAKLVDTINTILTETREVISIAETTGVHMNALRQAITRIKGTFMATTTAMTNLKEKSFALNKVVYDLKCFIRAAESAVDENGHFIVSEYKGIANADIQIKRVNPDADTGYFDTNEDIDGIIDSVRALIVSIRESIHKDNIEDSQMLIADMKLVSVAIKEHYHAVQAAAASASDDKDRFSGAKEHTLGANEPAYDVNDLSYLKDISFSDEVIEAFESNLVANEETLGDKDVISDADVDALISVTNAKSHLTCFIWAVKLASKNGSFDMSKYQGMEHASDQVPFNTMMSGDDVSEDDEVRDLVRGYLLASHVFKNQPEFMETATTVACEERYIRDATTALSSCRVLIRDRASAHGKSVSDIYATIRANRSNDPFVLNDDQTGWGLGLAELKSHLAINPFDVPVGLLGERNLLDPSDSSTLPIDDVGISFNDNDLAVEILEPELDSDDPYCDLPDEDDSDLDLDFYHGESFSMGPESIEEALRVSRAADDRYEKTVAGELRRLLALEFTTKGSM